MNEILERHWKEMRKGAAVALRERRRFKPAIRAEIVVELHQLARLMLDANLPKWREVPPIALAETLNGFGLFSYGGASFTDDTARHLRLALTKADEALSAAHDLENSELRARFRTVIPKLSGPWSEEVHREAAYVALRMLEYAPHRGSELGQAADLVMRKLESYELKRPRRE